MLNLGLKSFVVRSILVHTFMYIKQGQFRSFKKKYHSPKFLVVCNVIKIRCSNSFFCLLIGNWGKLSSTALEKVSSTSAVLENLLQYLHCHWSAKYVIKYKSYFSDLSKIRSLLFCGDFHFFVMKSKKKFAPMKWIHQCSNLSNQISMLVTGQVYRYLPYH